MSIQSSDIFTQRVSELMKRCFLTKKDMAQKLNVDYSTFWRKLNGQRNVDMVLLRKIAEILGTSTAYLTGETDAPSAIHQEIPASKYQINYAYWGGVVDNTKEVIANGDKATIAYVSQILKLALSLLADKIELQIPLLPTKSKTSVTNMPVIVGDNNESNLTIEDG